MRMTFRVTCVPIFDCDFSRTEKINKKTVHFNVIINLQLNVIRTLLEKKSSSGCNSSR